QRDCDGIENQDIQFMLQGLRNGCPVHVRAQDDDRVATLRSNGTDHVSYLGRSYLSEREIIAQAEMSLGMTGNTFTRPNLAYAQLHIVGIGRHEANPLRAPR